VTAIGGGWPLTETRHINLLELQAVVLVLQHFKPLPQGKHVLVRSDNRTTVAYINRQDGVSSAALLSAAENLWLWASENVFISKGPPHSGKWRTVGPASCRDEWWFSLARQDNPPFGVDTFAHKPWPRKLLYAFPPLRLIPPLLERVRREQLSVILVAPGRGSVLWYAEVTQMMVGQPAFPPEGRLAVV